MDALPKFVSIVCLIQTLFIVTGYLITRFWLRVWERFSGAPASYAGGLLEFVYAYGPWFLLVPVVWGIVATLQMQKEIRGVSFVAIHFVIGIGLTVLIVLAFSVSAIYAICMCFGHHRLS
jgi:hypothetical protein